MNNILRHLLHSEAVGVMVHSGGLKNLKTRFVPDDGRATYGIFLIKYWVSKPIPKGSK